MIRITNCEFRLGQSDGQAIHFRLPELSVAAGEQLALTGPSGCGKSTLLNIISGLIKPGVGTIDVAGQDLGLLRPSDLDRFRGQHIGFVYQSFNLIDAFTAEENVRVGMRFGRAIPRSEQSDRAADLLDRVGLTHRMHARPFRMSVGERQRVAIARALANKPKILLADEPTGALDPETATRVFELIRSLCEEQQCTLAFVTHDHALAEQLPREFDCRELIRQEAAT